MSRALAGDYSQIVLVGPEFQPTSGGDKVLWFPDVEAAVAHFHQHPLNCATILLKGSNSTRMWLLEPEF